MVMETTSGQAAHSAVKSPHLQALLALVDTVTEEARAFLQGLSPEQLTWKPDPQTWSIAECFDHLIVTDRLYQERLREAVRRGRDKRTLATSPFRPGFLGRILIETVKPDYPRKIKTFRIFRPRHNYTNSPAVIAAFIDKQADLSGLLCAADALDLNRNRVSSPVTPLLRFSIGECLTFLIYHQQRHLLQARRLTQSANFPA